MGTPINQHPEKVLLAKLAPWALTARSWWQSLRVISLTRQPEACQHIRVFLLILPHKLYNQLNTSLCVVVIGITIGDAG